MWYCILYLLVLGFLYRLGMCLFFVGDRADPFNTQQPTEVSDFLGDHGHRIWKRSYQKAAGAAYVHAKENLHQLDEQCLLQE